jgi:hypothetical protein
VEGKLIKVEDTFYLKVGETILGTSSNPNLSASIRYSLSPSNCQAVECCVDLDTLVLSFYTKTEWDVEIVTITRMENGKSGLDAPVERAKLDENGYLILKRI